MAKITEGPNRDVLEKLRRLSYKIEEINRRFDTFAFTGETFGDLKVKVYRHEAEMVELRRQVELSSAPLPPLNQQAGNDRFPIPIYSGERSTLHNFLKLFHAWAVSFQPEDALNHSRPNYDRGHLA